MPTTPTTITGQPDIEEPPINITRPLLTRDIRQPYALYNGFLYNTYTGIVVDNNNEIWTGIQPPGCVHTEDGYLVPWFQ